MQELIDKIERADCYILAAPTNFGSVTAIFKRFMERLAVYAYWPWDINGPQYRKAQAPKKKALLVSSCAAPGILGRWIFGTDKQLKVTAKTIGALKFPEPRTRRPVALFSSASALFCTVVHTYPTANRHKQPTAP